MYFVDCPDNHRFCFDCMKGHIQARLSGSSTVTCPGCKYILKEHEVGHIDRGLKEKYSDLLFKQAINAPGFFNCKCSNTIALNNPSESEHFECKKCNSHWCTLCNETYHYSKNCEEYKKVKHVWDTWKTSGRQQYQMKLKQQEVDFKNKVKEYEVMKKKLEEDQVIAKKNFDILAQDEQKKGATCRRCPNCNRVVERVSGCSSMVFFNFFFFFFKFFRCFLTFHTNYSFFRFVDRMPMEETLKVDVEKALIGTQPNLILQKFPMHLN